MKLNSPISTGLLALSLLAVASAEEPVKFSVPGVTAPAQPPAASPAIPTAAPAAPKFTETQVFEAYGWLMGVQMGLNALEFSPEQVAALARGLQHVAAGDQPPAEFQSIGPEVEAMLKKKNDAFLFKLRQRNLSDAAAFFTKLKENKNVQELPSGLRFEVVKAGTGAAPKLGQIAKIHYTGTFPSGQTFDSSVQRNEPLEIFVNNPTKEDPRGAIPGMVEGLQKMNVGGKYKLYLPPHLAYGDEGNQGIPPAATLVFEVELLEVKNAPPPAAPGK